MVSLEPVYVGISWYLSFEEIIPSTIQATMISLATVVELVSLTYKVLLIIRLFVLSNFRNLELQPYPSISNLYLYLRAVSTSIGTRLQSVTVQLPHYSSSPPSESPRPFRHRLRLSTDNHPVQLHRFYKLPQ
jgi:hypothetical protein